MFRHQRQSICVKWDKRTSEYFSIINGVRQGGVLSPQLFDIYMNDLSVCLTQCNAGCHLNETVTNHVMYADDICLMAPSAIALQKMLNLCYEFSLSNDIYSILLNLNVWYLNQIDSNYTAQLYT